MEGIIVKDSRTNDMNLQKRIESVLKKNQARNTMKNFIKNSKIKLEPLKYISIMTTSVCTSNCVYCPYPYAWTTKNPGYMSDELYQKIVLDIKNTYPGFGGHYSYQNGNEPTADPKFIERMEYFYQQLPNARINFPTNANLLTPERSKQLIDLMLRYEDFNDGRIHYGILVHFAGTDKESWNEIMGSRYEYEDVVHNIQSLLKYNNQRDNIIPIDIMGYHGADPHGSTLFDMNEEVAYTKENLDLWFYDPEDYEKHLRSLFDGIAPYSWNTMLFQNRAGDLRLFDEWRGNRQVREIGPDNEFTCARFFDGKGLHVLYDGSVTVCCNDWQKRNILGNLSSQTISELFDSEEYKEFMYMGHGYISSPPDFICKLCTDMQAIQDEGMS